MAQRQPITIGDKTFPTKKATVEHCREILYRSPPGQPMPAQDAEFLRALLDGHPEVARKVGCGIDHFEVCKDPVFGTFCFWLVRTDGTSTDFSFNECLSPSSPFRKVKAALRAVVVPDILAFKHGWFDRTPVDAWRCPIMGTALEPDDCHVDHAPPWTFDRIVSEFLASRVLNPEAVELLPPYDGCVVDRLANEGLAAAFRALHKERATLRIVSPRANLSVLRRGTNR